MILMSSVIPDYDKLTDEEKLSVNMATLDMLAPVLESQGNPQIAFQLREIRSRLDDYRRTMRRGYPTAD